MAVRHTDGNLVLIVERAGKHALPALDRSSAEPARPYWVMVMLLVAWTEP